MNPAPLLASLHQMWGQAQVGLPDAQPLPSGSGPAGGTADPVGKGRLEMPPCGRGVCELQPLAPSEDRNGTQGAQLPAPRLHTVPSGPQPRAGLTSGESEDEYQSQ